MCFNFTYFTADEETVGFKTLNIDLLNILSCCKTFHFHIAKVPVVLHLSTHTSQDLLNIVFLKHCFNCVQTSDKRLLKKLQMHSLQHKRFLNVRLIFDRGHFTDSMADETLKKYIFQMKTHY